MKNLNGGKAERLLFPALVAICAGGYWAGLSGGFFFDDGPSIMYAPGVRMNELNWEQVLAALHSGGAGPSGRPVSQFSFALNHYFSEFDPWYFKLTNLIIHLICGWVVLKILQEIFGHGCEANVQNSRLIAALGAGLWLLHPLQLLPVLHVVQRMTSMSAMFLLMALWLHMLARRSAGITALAYGFMAWCVLWPLSILSKETGILLPGFVLCWELLLRRRPNEPLDAAAKSIVVAIALVGVATLAYLFSERSQWVWAGYDFRPFDATQRLLTQTRVLWFYVALAFAPSVRTLGLYHDDVQVSTDIVSPWTTLPALLGWLSVIGLIWGLRTRAPLVAFGMSVFAMGHLVESTVFPLELVHEHRNYLPLLGLIIAAIAAVAKVAEYVGMPRRGLVGMAVGAVVACTATTMLRAYQYGDELRRTLAEVEHHPHSARAQYNLGIVLSELAKGPSENMVALDMARGHLLLASALDPEIKISLLEIISVDCRAGLGVNREALEKLSTRLQKTNFAPADRNVLYYLKEMALSNQICLNRREITGLFDAALDNPKVGAGVKAMLFSWKADYLWLVVGDMTEAKASLQSALDIDAGSISNRHKWAQLLWEEGNYETARQLLLQLRGERLSPEERSVLEALLNRVNTNAE